jgi:uncharacterized SAM-binding protein YcdF (DUF218 family)
MKFLIPFLEPLGLMWIGLAILVAWTLRRRHRRIATALGLIWMILTLATCMPVPSVLLGTLEQPWLGRDLKSMEPADAIVSLGGAGRVSSLEVTGFQMRRGADRLITAIELLRRGKAGTLVIGGGGQPGTNGGWESEADAAKRWIESWKIVPAPTISLGVCSDTRDEAVKTATLARERGWRRVILVTSASHMNRAEAVFRKAGLEVEPAPCNFLSSVVSEPELRWFHPPSYNGLEAFFLWFHEFIGSRVYRWRGWI